MNYKLTKTLSFISCFCLILFSILSIVDFWCFNKDFYIYEYTNLNTAQSIGMSNDDLKTTTDLLLDYLKDSKDNLDLKINVKGENREVFNQREKTHMVDVKDLYIKAMIVKDIAGGVFIVLFILLLCFHKIDKLFIGYKKSLLFFGFIFLTILIFCLIDFDSFWISFHKIFFTKNDFWLLDPRTDILIMMVPSKFFFDLCFLIVISVILMMLFYYLIFYFLIKKGHSIYD